MPRKPLITYFPEENIGTITFGRFEPVIEPELISRVGACILLWPYVETNMAMILAHLLKATDITTIAVFQVLRRSSAQREAIAEAAKHALSERDHELTLALLSVHKSIEAERNALAHGHFGHAHKLPGILLWQNSRSFLDFGLNTKIMAWNLPAKSRLLNSLYVYEPKDIEDIYEAIISLRGYWAAFLKYLREPVAEKREELYRRLCSKSHIAEALVRIRQKNNQTTQPQSPQPDPSAK